MRVRFGLSNLAEVPVRWTVDIDAGNFGCSIVGRLVETAGHLAARTLHKENFVPEVIVVGKIVDESHC